MSPNSRSDRAELRLEELGIKLPKPPEPFGIYAEAVQTGNLLFLTGMLPRKVARPNSLGASARSWTRKRGMRRRGLRRSTASLSRVSIWGHSIKSSGSCG
jgi:hypothetical protein